MAQPTMGPNSAPTPPRTPIPSASLIGNIADAKRSVLLILKETDWPKEASNDAQALIQTMEAPLDLDKLPKDEAQISAELKGLLKLLLRELEIAQAGVQAESKKHGTRKKWFKKQVKKLFSRADPNQCNEMLRSCRTDVEESSAMLNRMLSDLDIGSEQQRTLQRAKDDGKDHSARLPATPTPLAPTAGLSPTTSVVQADSASNRSALAPQVRQVAGVQAGPQKRRLGPGHSMIGVRKKLRIILSISEGLPVIESYVWALARMGMTMLTIVQDMYKSNEPVDILGTHVVSLASELYRVSQQARHPERSETTNGIEALQQTLRDIQHEIENLQTQGSVKNDQPGSLQKDVCSILEEVQFLSSLNTSILVAELHNEALQSKRRHLLDCLGDQEYGAWCNGIQYVKCLPGTRVEILDRIDVWLRDWPSSERVLWIRGMAGRGKSTIASTVAHRWEGRACSAIYHFRRGQNALNASLVCALARQLGRSVDPELRNAILSTVEKNEDIVNQGLEEQFAAVFAVSLGTLKAKAFPIIIIVDALDECEPVDYALDFVKLIDRYSSSLPDNVKFLLTSRPEAQLLRTLVPRKWRTENLDSNTDVDADIERFLRHALVQVKTKHRIEGEWPSADVVSALVKMSQGLFQWGRTVAEYINDGSPMNRLGELLESPTMWSGLDGLYTQIVSKALEELKQNWAKRNLLLDLLGILVAAPYPVSLETISILHAENDLIKGQSAETVDNFLRQELLAAMKSLLYVPFRSSEPIRLVHTSVRDLLVDRERCAGHLHWVDLPKNHQRLAAACIRYMNQNLRENICDLTELSKPTSEVQDLVDRKVSGVVRYCCRSWSIHLTRGEQALQLGADSRLSQESGFELFSIQNVLFWLEVMSLVKCFNHAIMMAKEVHQWLLNQQSQETPAPRRLVTLWNDVQLFTAAFSEPIAFNPLHLYASALPHCPVETELWKHYSTHAKVRTIRGVQPATWSSDLWTRSLGTNVNSASPSDGVLPAPGCNDTMLRVVDPHTDRQMHEPLPGYSSTVYSISFSPDGKRLASGSSDNTIRLWNSLTGRQLGDPLTGHSKPVHSVCFSPEGKLLASGSEDNTIRLWDSQTGSQFGVPLSGHNNIVCSICFSPDGKLLASGSYDTTIRLWNPQTGRDVGEPLTGHRNNVRSVCFSPDGKLLASGSDDCTIRLWDLQAGGQAGEPLIGFTAAVHSARFSSSDDLIVGRDLAGNSMAWNVLTLQRHSIPPCIPRVDTLDYNHHWVTFSSSRLFWLPARYWDNILLTHIVILCEGKLAVSHGNTLSLFDVSDALRLYNRL